MPREALLNVTPVEFDKLDKELGKEKVKDVLGDYFEETQSAVQGLLCDNLGLTTGESAEAMEVDPQAEPSADTLDQPMETEKLGSSPGNFRSELMKPGYTPSLFSSADSPPSPITAKDNALLDASDSGTPGQDQSKAQGAS